MIKGEIVEFTNPSEDEIGLKFILLEDPDGGRVCAEALVNMVIRPCYILRLSDIRLAAKQDIECLRSQCEQTLVE